MSRLPIRVRLTAAFALAMLCVLAGAGLFVYLRLRSDLNDGVNATLRNRISAVERESSNATPRVRGINFEDRKESLVQVLTPDGRLLDVVGGARRAALSPAEASRAALRTVRLERSVPGIDGTDTHFARTTASTSGPVIVAAGQSLVDRDEALKGVVASFVVGGAIAILLASGIGYLLARAGLAPVEAMTRRAREVSLTRADERLPLPEAHDEVRRLGETLNEMLDRLRHSFERERRFVSDASHELRTPIAIVKTELEGALRTGDYGPPVHEALVAAIEGATASLNWPKTCSSSLARARRAAGPARVVGGPAPPGRNTRQVFGPCSPAGTQHSHRGGWRQTHECRSASNAPGAGKPGGQLASPRRGRDRPQLRRRIRTRGAGGFRRRPGVHAGDCHTCVRPLRPR